MALRLHSHTSQPFSSTLLMTAQSWGQGTRPPGYTGQSLRSCGEPGLHSHRGHPVDSSSTVCTAQSVGQGTSGGHWHLQEGQPVCRSTSGRQVLGQVWAGQVKVSEEQEHVGHSPGPATTGWHPSPHSRAGHSAGRIQYEALWHLR